MSSNVEKISADRVLDDLIGSPVTVIVDDYSPSKTVETFNDLSELFLFEDSMDVFTKSGHHYQVWIVEDAENVFGYNSSIALICLRDNDEDVQLFGFGVEVVNWEYRNLYIRDKSIVELTEQKKVVTTYNVLN